jgi:Holliday junction resolvase RusA-like endonuclease
MIKLSLPLCCPLNALYRALPYAIKLKAGGTMTKAHMVLSKRARIKRDEITACIWAQLGGRPQAMEGDVCVQVLITPRNARTPDVDAYTKHLLDILAHAGVYKNDKQVVRKTVERAQFAEMPGRMDVEVWEL